ncbi:MAG TPA: hypothetical protein VFA84_14670 [Acidimicrobiales bacterium]|nr:hypothetical protein [Acidimicrobiales bacterium]
MNDDELIDRLRRTLRDEATQVHAPPDGWERFQRRAAGASPARSRWVVAAPVAALGLAAAIVAAVLVTSNGTSTTKGRTELATPAARPATTAAASASATTAAAAAGNAGAAAAPAPTAPTFAPSASAANVPPGFTPRSVTFVSPTEGFVLGASAVAHTVDAGRTWTALPALPHAKVSELRFANAHDGWAWGPELWATHDGGHSWHQLTVPGGEGGVYALEAAAGAVHMVVFDGQAFRVATAPVASDAFSVSLGAAAIPVGAGPVPTVQLVLQGRTGWAIEVDRTVVGGLRLVDGAWQPWTPPCLTGNGPAVIAASSATEVVAACDEGVWGPAPQTGERLWVSHDGGATFTGAGPIPGGHALAVASPSAGTIVAAVQAAGPAALEATFDAGATWSQVSTAAGVDAADLGFTTATQGVVVFRTPAGDGGTLQITRDGGRTWREVAFS